MMLHRALLRLAPALRGPILRCTALGVFIAACYLAQALLIATALTDLLTGRTDRVAGWLIAALAVIVARGALLVARDGVAAAAGAEVRARLRDRLVARLGELGPTWVRGSRAGAVRAALVDGVEGLDAYYSRYLPQAAVCLTVPPVVVAALVFVEPVAAAVLGVAVALALLAPRWWDGLLARRAQRKQESYEAVSADYLEAMHGMVTLRALGAVGRTRQRLERRSQQLRDDTVRTFRVSLVDTGITDFAIQGGMAAAVALATWSLTAGQLGAGGLVAVLLLSNECFRPIRDLAGAWHAGYLGTSAISGITALLDAKSTVPDTGHRELTLSGPPTVQLRGASLTYPGRDRPAVRSLHLTLEPGTTTALIGRSGAGKSTVAALLQRLHDPDSGAVLIDGRDIREYTLHSLRRAIAVVEQEVTLFSGTLADNLRLARPNATEDQLRHALAQAGASDVLELHDHVGEGGTTLSGGQRQRIALARALLAGQGRLLILDEATAHVDGRQEDTIVDTLAEAAAGRTCLVIAHRLSAVRRADHVIVLADGRVVQQGTPAQLMSCGGAYSELLTGRVA